MRRASTCLAVLGLTAFGLAAFGLSAVTAAAEVPTPKISKFKAKAVPIPKPGGGTYKETGNIFGAGAAIEVEYEFEGTGYGPSAGNPAGGIPPLSGVNFYLPAGTKLHTAGFATCTKEKLEKEGAQGCPTKSQASPLGAALGEVYFGSERVPEEATLQGFFAPGGNLLFFTKYHSGAVNPSAPLGAPAAVEIVSPGHFVASSGKYSKEFIGEVPKVETVKGAPLASGQIDQGRDRRGVHERQGTGLLRHDPADVPERRLSAEDRSDLRRRIRRGTRIRPAGENRDGRIQGAVSHETSEEEKVDACE